MMISKIKLLFLIKYLEPEIECEMNIELNIKEDVYPKYFNNNNSEIYIYSSENNKGESFIVMVNKSVCLCYNFNLIFFFCN